VKIRISRRLRSGNAGCHADGSSNVHYCNVAYRVVWVRNLVCHTQEGTKADGAVGDGVRMGWWK